MSSKNVSLFILLSLLVACDKTKPVSKNDFDVTNVTYFQDPRTDLCFGAIISTRMSTQGSYAENVIVTNVPCTEKVLGLLK